MRYWREFRDSMHFFALLLPVAVVAILVVGFLFGLRCASWQWWTAVSAVGAWLLSRRPLRRGLVGLGALAAILTLMWAAAAVFLIPSAMSYDYAHYHLPAIRLLIAGWIPWLQTSPAMLSAACSIDPAEMSCWHVLAMPHGEWYFDAAASAFLGVNWNLLFACPFIVCLALALTAWRVTDTLPVGFRLLVVALSYAVIPQWILVLMPHDSTLAMAAIGLLLSMWRTMKTGEWHWPELVGFSFWLCTGKQMSLLHCFLFWSVFGIALLVRRFSWLEIRRLVGVAGLLCLLTLTVCSAPYLSAWRDYGHPLYPVCSSDHEKHPAINMTGDFLRRNADAERLGRVGMWLNAFVSAKTVSVGYAACLGQESFAPDVAAWRELTDYGSHPGSPTSALDKLLFLLPLLLLLVIGGFAERTVALAVVATTLTMPSEYIGYVRYVPWFCVCGVFCIPALWERISGRFPGIGSKWFSRAAVLCAVAVSVGFLKPLSKSVDVASSVSRALREEPPQEILYHAHSGATSIDATAVAGLRLMLRQNPTLGKATLSPSDGHDGAQPFYNGSMLVPKTYDLSRFAGPRRHFKERALFLTLPQSVFLRVCEAFTGRYE